MLQKYSLLSSINCTSYARYVGIENRIDVNQIINIIILLLILDVFVFNGQITARKRSKLNATIVNTEQFKLIC